MYGSKSRNLRNTLSVFATDTEDPESTCNHHTCGGGRYAWYMFSILTIFAGRGLAAGAQNATIFPHLMFYKFD